MPTSDRQLTLSDGEKLILLMLCDLYKHLKVKGEIDPKFIEAAIEGGHYWGLKRQYSGIFHERAYNDEIVREAEDMLEMWYFIEHGYRKLSKVDKDRVAKEAEPFGKHVSFPGFDGNNESEYLSVARFLIDKLDLYSTFKGRRDLNSHAPLLGSYRKMLSVFGRIRPTLMGRELNASEIIEMLKAGFPASQSP